MKKIITLNDFIKYVYQQAGSEEDLSTEQTHYDESDSAENADDLIDDIKVSPSEQTVKNILNYSKALGVIKMKKFHDIETIAN